MTNIAKELNRLRPYVMGIRYLTDSIVVDFSASVGWILPPSKRIFNKNVEENYYILFSDNPTVELDELLAYSELIIKVNLEREAKVKLYSETVVKLKQLFKDNDIESLINITFKLDKTDKIEVLDIFTDEKLELELELEPRIPLIDGEFVENIDTDISNTGYVEEQVNLTEDEMEMIAEDKRYQANKNFKNKRK